MEDFEYSVEICDRDWECFFAECEECNLLPPSLAGLDSGMSDFDETGSRRKRAHKVDLTSGFSEADRPIDGPPYCEGSPVEHYLSKHGAGGMESILSGSEEDTHLQSVNIFFERLKNLSEAERLAKPCQERTGGNREAAMEEKQCSDGQRSRGSTLPKNIPKLNSPPARGETAVGAETTRPVDAISNTNTKKKVKSGSNISRDAAASNSVLKTNTSANPETELFIREEACTQTAVNEATQWNQFHDPLESEIPHTDKVVKVQMCTPLKDAKQEHFFTSPFTFSEKCNIYSPGNAEMVTRIKRKEEHNPVLQLDTTSLNKSASPESPSASIKRKRRKKRRLSFEPAESVHGYDRRFLVRPSDSEEEQYAGRGGTGLCIPEDVNLFYLNAPQSNVASSLYSVSSRLPVRTSAKEIKTNDCSHIVPSCDSRYQYTLRQERCKATSLAENNATNNKSVTPCVDNAISATSSSGNVETNSRPCMKLQVEELTGLNKHPSNPGSVTGESDRKTANSADSLQESDKVIHSIRGCENEHNLKCCTAEVKSIAHSVSPRAESDDRAVGVGQNDKLSDAKSVLAAEAGNSVSDDSTPCHGEAEPQQQLEIECHDTDQFSSTLDNTKPQQFKTTARPFIQEISSEVTFPDTLPCLSKSASNLDINNTIEKEERPVEVQALSKLAQLAASQLISPGNPCPSVEIISQRQIKLSTSKDLITSPSDITSLSSLLTESGTSLSNENITDLSGGLSSSVGQNESGGQTEKNPLMLFKQDRKAESGPKSWSESNYSTESKCDSLDGAEEAVAAECEPENAPDSKHSVFAISSFWNEMERLTINDILGSRSLPTLHESQETDMSATTDSGFFTQSDESKLKQTSEHMSSVLDLVESNSCAFMGADSCVLWESEPVPMSLGSDVGVMTSVSDMSQPVFSGNAQSFRTISKTLSVHNLPALKSESFSSTWKGQTLQTLNEGGSEKLDCLVEDNMPKQAEMDSSPSSLTDGYRISVSDIFQYLFGGKQSLPCQSATNNINAVYADGNSVPENYDHFFSEFDTENFFCPLIPAEDQAKGEQVPIFSYSRSACRNLQFPEAYDGFFPSSSSDDSSVESDEEDNSKPVRVVTRFSHNASASQISTDIYDNFFTDSDLRENFFWKATLSFRNKNFSGIAVQKQTSSQTCHVPARQSGRSLRRTLYPSNALGNQDVMLPDPLLYHLENRISRQQALQPFRNEDLQMAVSNPRLDSSLLPLRQSDMCLVCIAFASWVLKTANPQVGDAWKAVLLANVSALSAIRYLRKYVKIEAAASEKKLHQNAPS